MFGGPESHAAIMARALGLPAVIGVPDLVARARNGATVILDGGEGIVILDPTPATLEVYRRRQEDFTRERRNLGRLRRLAAVTRDGVEIRLDANLETLDNLREHLKDHNLDFTTIPYVLQLNKRDLPNILPVADLQKHLLVKNEPTLEAVAVTGQGVFDTLKEVAKLVLAELKKNA